MILIDPRVGSGELLEPLRKLNLPAEHAQLDFADIAFAGQGPDGSTVSVGIERKKLPDLLGSFASGRLISHQVPGLLDSFDAVWLFVEGRYRSGAGGLLEWGQERPWKDAAIVNWSDAGYGMRRWMYREIENRLTTLELKTGLRVKRTADSEETVAALACLYDWFTNSQWDEHNSHLPAALKATMDGKGVRLVPPSMRERMAAQLPHVGSKLAGAVAAHFPTAHAMINAEADEWMALPRVGKKVAQDIVKAIRGQM